MGFSVVKCGRNWYSTLPPQSKTSSTTGILIASTPPGATPSRVSLCRQGIFCSKIQRFKNGTPELMGAQAAARRERGDGMRTGRRLCVAVALFLAAAPHARCTFRARAFLPVVRTESWSGDTRRTQASGAIPTTETTFERFHRTPQLQLSAPKRTRHRPPLVLASQHERAKFVPLLFTAAACAFDPSVQRAVRGGEISRCRFTSAGQFPKGMCGCFRGKSNIVSVHFFGQSYGLVVTAFCSLRSRA